MYSIFNKYKHMMLIIIISRQVDQVMQYIKNIIHLTPDSSALDIVAAGLCVASWLLLYKTEQTKACDNTILRFIIFVNVVTIYECIFHPSNVVSVVLLIKLINWGHYYQSHSSSLQNKRNSDKSIIEQQHIITKRSTSLTRSILVFAILVVVQPMFVPVYMVDFLASVYIKINNNKQSYDSQELLQSDTTPVTKQKVIKIFLSIITSIFIAFTIILLLYSSYYFPVTYPKSSNSIWLLYSHIFQSYSLLYQTICILLPFLTILPLVFSQVHKITKLTVQYFVCIFFMAQISIIHLWVLYYLYAIMYKQLMTHPTLRDKKRKQVIWNVINIMVIVISVPSYIFYERLVWLWQHTHFVSIGFFLVQLLVFWGVHAVYLSESLIMLEDQQQGQHSKKKMITKIKDYLVEKIKDM